jgi:hypothetical protein
MTMSLNRLVKWVAIAVCIVGLCGCEKKSGTSAPAPGAAPAATDTKTAEQYKAEADKQITEKNASDELKKLEQEVGADANQS